MKLSTRLNSFLASARSAAGFTMIELLIVISILGILAVAVLSAINPVEQINRGRDTGSRSDAEQLLSAIDRFNAFQGYYPWVYNPTDDHTIDDGAGGPLQVTDAWFVGGAAATANDCSVLLRLGTGDAAATDACTGSLEVKESFTSRVTDTGANPLYIYNDGAQGSSTYVCFTPQSGAFVQEAETRCQDATGTGLPNDMAGIADEVCGGYATDPTLMMICLP
ncbi:MAG: hypothetical protein CO156_01380 [Candidatus Pacebacteria bacterium CG_4_9_14_3_um_filter_40_12]|nr:type II secretion system protein [Candidatus Paceibacterota bacterium]PIZ79076.1 MAG: hypothetical protein COY01_01455 [Candidatus Pacebacteria bacterium CG_4_10_14_0_2_um_filter_40_20]PJA69236.1 MAG: hypothetical protein CO156_01380 [Candidatus Pacebacteria bacterium CG_4_9_14_3_um_filter_40_12]PJC42042.1 MAG: hypothetical protein CO041_00165 [Candidatus Pacebacteria bacterium CG_4_9_14_0_2_um_filter_40_15]